MGKKLPHTSREHGQAWGLLEDLPRNAVVLDRDGYAWQEGGWAGSGYWFSTMYSDLEPLSSYDLAFHYPLTPMKPKK